MKKIFYSSNSKGMSLVEVVVSVALFAIAVVFLSTCFLAGLSIIGDAAKLTENSEDIKGRLEEQAAGSTGSTAEDTVTFTAPDGTIYTVKGEYAEVVGEDGLTYKVFIPDSSK